MRPANGHRHAPEAGAAGLAGRVGRCRAARPAKPAFLRYIKGTVLENDVPVWIATFTQQMLVRELSRIRAVIASDRCDGDTDYAAEPTPPEPSTSPPLTSGDPIHDNPGMTDILDLKGWTVLGRTEEDGADVLEAGVPAAHAYRLPKVRHPRLHLPARHQSYYLRRHSDAREAGQAAGEGPAIPVHLLRGDLPAAAGRHLGGPAHDGALRHHIKAHSLRGHLHPHRGERGCDDKTVRTLGAEYMAELEASHRPEMPDWLGIDGPKSTEDALRPDGHRGRRILDMLPDRDKATFGGVAAPVQDRHWVRAWPSTCGGRTGTCRTRCSLADRWSSTSSTSSAWRTTAWAGPHPAPEAAQGWRAAPVAPVQGDAEHAVRQAGREGPVQSGHVAGQRPELAAAYGLKEAFYNIYDLPKAQAVAAFDAFQGPSQPA